MAMQTLFGRLDILGGGSGRKKKKGGNCILNVLKPFTDMPLIDWFRIECASRRNLL